MIPFAGFFAGSAGKILLVIVIFAAGAGTGFKGGHLYATSSMQELVDEAKEEKKKVEDAYAGYRTEQKEKLEKLELDSRLAAEEAKAKTEAYRKKMAVANSKYQKILEERKETPSRLSTSAVDTINSFVNDWQQPEK